MSVFLLLTCILALNIRQISNTKDLNIHELQFVADHLPLDVCQRLVTSLHTNDWEVDIHMPASVDKALTCIELLVLWDQSDAVNATFHHLTHRLRQFGFTEVADKISETVYTEKSEALQHLFLDDPFKKKIHKNSPILDIKKHKKKTKNTVEEPEDPFDAIKTAFMITGGISVAIILLSIARYCCVGFTALVFPIICPAQVVECCDASWSALTICCKKCASNTKTHLLGAGLENHSGRSKV